MDNDPPYEIEKIEETSGGRSYASYSFKSGPGMPWKTKLILAGIVLGGIVVGTLLFLFFVTVFVYFFLPALAVFLLWRFLSARH